VKAAMKRHLAMVQENHTDGCLQCQTATAQNPHTCWMFKSTGAPTPEQLRQLTREPMSHLYRMPPVPPTNHEGAGASGIQGVPPRYEYLHTRLPSAQFFNLDAYAKDRKRDKTFDPNLLTDAGTTTG